MTDAELEYWITGRLARERASDYFYALRRENKTVQYAVFAGILTCERKVTDYNPEHTFAIFRGRPQPWLPYRDYKFPDISREVYFTPLYEVHDLW